METISQENYLPSTVAELEETLAQKRYKPFKRVNYDELTPHLLEGVKVQDNVVSFGEKAITLFDDLCKEFERLPSQREYIARGIFVYEAYWRDNRYTNKKIGGYPFNNGVRLGIMDRLARTYTSKVVELHLELMLKEKGYTVKTHPLMDSIMGVDIVAEDSSKRYYIHVTTSKKGVAGAERSVASKEKRTKFPSPSGAWVTYGRDFSNDCVLVYESITPLGNDSTKWINGNPVFNSDYIDDYFYLKKRNRKIESVSVAQSKLDGFVTWAKSRMKEDIAFQ